MNKFVKVSYNLYTFSEDGKQDLVERASTEHPFQFITGMDIALDAFEQKIEELEEGDEFNFVVPVEQAYGPYVQERVIELSKEDFCIDGHFDMHNIFPGNTILLVNDDGNRFNAVVKEVGKTTVTLDLNHPFAGHTLQYKGRLLESREATKEEVQGMINLMSGEGCGCGCDDCGGHGHGQEGHDGHGGCCGGHGGCGHKHEHGGEHPHCDGQHRHGHHGEGCCGHRHND